MPCYCDTPSEEDQEEIERRAKVRMCMEADFIISKRGKHGGTFGDLGNPNDFLCKLCKLLSDEEMKDISAYQYLIKWPYKTLYDWHLQHLIDDKSFNEDELKENTG